MSKNWYHFSWQKRALDVVVSATVLLVLAPVLVGVIILIWLTAGFPIFYRQRRLGYRKHPFTLWKFRTMKPNADQLKKRLWRRNEAPWPMFKMESDPRFTRVGRFLSWTGLDEVPQLWQIIRGQMSLIGPRPLPIEEAKQLPSSWNFRYQVKPGILSEWAIAPDRYASLQRWRQLEQQTIQLDSFGADLRLLARAGIYLARGNARSLLQRQKRRVRLRRALPSIPSQSPPISARKRAPLGSLAQ